MAGISRVEVKEDTLPPLDSPLFPRAPAQRWHSVSRRSDLRPLSQSRSNKLLMIVGLGAVILLLGGGVAWLVSQSLASDGRVLAAQNGEVARITPVAATPGAPASAPTAAAPATPDFHIVQTGESLTAIATKYNTTVETLAELNKIENVDSIRVGQRLRLVPEAQ